MGHQSTNLKFMNAVIRWLAAFPSSPIKKTDAIERLVDPDIIVDILKLVLDEDFNVSKDIVDDGDVGSPDLVALYESIFDNVLTYYSRKLISKKKLVKYLSLIRFSKLFEGDYFHLNILCFMLFEIGLHSFKSSISISVISTLDEEDQSQLKSFMYDEHELHDRNLILTQEINLMEMDNAVLKEKLKHELSKNKSLNVQLIQLKNSSELQIEELENTLKSKNTKIEELMKSNENLRKSNKGLKIKLDQVNNDIDLISSLSKNRSQNPQTQEAPSNVSASIKIYGDDDKIVRWELQLLKELLNYKYSKKS